MRRTLGILMLILSAFLGTIAFRLSTPAIAFYTRDILKASMLSISLVSVSFILARAFSSLFSGLLLEKDKRLIYLGSVTMAGNALIVHLYPLTTSWIQVVGIKILNGLLNGISWPIAQFAIASASPDNVRARVTSVYFFLASVASVIGNYVYAQMAELTLKEQMMVASIFYLLTALSMFLAYYLLFNYVTPKRKGGNVEELHLDPRKVLVITSLIAIITAFASGEITYVYVSEALGLGKGTTAKLIGWTGFIATALSYVTSWRADVGKVREMVSLLSMLASLSPLLASIKTPITVFLGIFLALFSAQSFRPISRKVLVAYRRSSLAIGGLNAVQNVSTFLGGLFFGLAYSLGELHSIITVNLGLASFLPFSIALIIIGRKVKV
ncbi:MFS transporter [Pyrococcus abyssi]|uniref:Transporter, major facilitator family n=1 Tax=Pyrococcus abyssi (strain GE5 / Orsay) TaxID=272844 RepID=Q9V2C2_PYRAB|nr:MFS transporter [Pyrococcus abyssi]CAB49076.1 Hypothetical protein PAB2250 [Pyrococcus abyssi GE5]CCE69528.1 TPA: Transporter, major facilitator family [Pyrococcus abyssi GE5]